MTELLCVEMMTRQLVTASAVHQHAVLTALAPWMENLSFAARWEGTPPASTQECPERLVGWRHCPLPPVGCALLCSCP